MQMDELWSRVNHFRQQAVGVAHQAMLKPALQVGVHIGERNWASAGCLWQARHRLYRQCAVVGA